MKYIVIIILLGILFLRLLPIIFPPFQGKTVRLQGTVTNYPTETFGKMWIRLGAISARVESSEIEYGDGVTVEGLVDDRQMKDARLVEHHMSHSVFKNIHEMLVGVITKALPGNHAALMAGIVFGDKEFISKNLNDQFKRAGVAHVVVASGMNVTLVAGFLLSILLKILGRRKAVIFSIGAIWFYILVAGVAAPLVRAGVMSTIAFVAQRTGRMNHTIRALVVSLYLMLLIFPWWLFDLGLWLSFAATLSLILFESKVLRYVSKVPSLLREGFSTSLAAQVLVAPLLFFSFGTISFVGPVVNALILWTLTPLMIIGLLGTMIGVIIPTLGQLVLYLSLPLTTWFFFIINTFS